MSAFSLRDARLDFKTTDSTKTLLSQAAALDGVDLTSFVLGPAVEKARRVISEHASIALAKQGQMALAQLLLSPKAAPTESMKRLMEVPDLPNRQHDD